VERDRGWEGGKGLATGDKVGDGRRQCGRC